jgi:hypothetical protein
VVAFRSAAVQIGLEQLHPFQVDLPATGKLRTSLAGQHVTIRIRNYDHNYEGLSYTIPNQQQRFAMSLVGNGISAAPVCLRPWSSLTFKSMPLLNNVVV